MNYKLHFTYKTGGKIKTAVSSNENFSVKLNKTEKGLKVLLTPVNPVEILDFYVERAYEFTENSRFLANGFQSWTDTKEFTKNERTPDLGLIGKGLFGKHFGMQYAGDYNFVKSKGEPGQFHSNSFAYVRNGEKVELFASLNDRTGYTVIYADMNNNTLRFSKDLEGVVINKPYEILDMYFDEGEYDTVFDNYFNALNIKPLTNKKLKGYTSWYNYYQNINQDIILRDLNSITAQKDLVNIFQIDDGYQTAVGDWLSVNIEKFPKSMKFIADSIHEKGLEAGIWLAPFAAQHNSKIVKEHPDWLITNEKGKPICVGPNWGGFYPLNIYNEQVRQYIKTVFNEVLNVWGFDLVKLDFLYAASIIPMNGKTRGEIAYDAIEFLRECVGDKKILGCGVQQMPCFGKVEYMRIGADMALGWKHNIIRRNTHREDVSTPNAIHNSIYRRCLNGRAFLCDPDVFLLRRDNIKFTPQQQKLLAKFIKIFGGVLFMSDNIADYDDEQLAVFKDVLTDDDTKLVAVNEVNDTVFIDYYQNGENHTLKFLVNTGDIF